jgi:hypothetical protein
MIAIHAIKVLVLVSIPLLFNDLNRSNADDTYELIESRNGIEIRQYRESVFASYSNSQDNSSNFSELAEYIFGGNEKRQRIEMTSPVRSNMYGKKEMLFLMPETVTIENYPAPNNERVKIIQTPARLTASIAFSGYADDLTCGKMKLELIDILTQNSMGYENDFQTLIYDPPYKRVGRLNEILVSIKNN